MRVDTGLRCRVDLPTPGVHLTGDPSTPGAARELRGPPVQHTIRGRALVREGDAGLRAFLDAQSELDDPQLRTLMVTTDAVSSLFPEQWAARVVVEADDEALDRLVETASDEPGVPLGWKGAGEKYDELTTVAGCRPRPPNRSTRFTNWRDRAWWTLAE